MKQTMHLFVQASCKNSHANEIRSDLFQPSSLSGKVDLTTVDCCVWKTLHRFSGCQFRAEKEEAKKCQ